jgi:hypothetical protein
LAGKYTSLEELERGHENAQTQLTVMGKENELLRKRLEAVMPLLDGADVSSRANPADRAPARTDDLTELATALNVEPEKLARGLGAVAADVFGRVMQPYVQGSQARQIVSMEDPDYLANEPKIARYLSEHPEAQRAVDAAVKSGNLDVAVMAHRWVKMAALGTTAPTNGATTGGTPPATTRSALEQALDAQLLGGPGTKQAGTGEDPGRDQKLADLRAKAYGGDARAGLDLVEALLAPHGHPNAKPLR